MLPLTTKGWTLDGLIADNPNFRHIHRIPAFTPDLNQRISDYENKCEPLIIEGWHTHQAWPRDLFSVQWFLQHGAQEMSARNVHDWTDRKLPLADFVAKARALPPHATEQESERLYGKDAECPPQYRSWIESGVLPASMLPNNDTMKFLPEEAQVETLMCYVGIGDTFTPAHKDLCASSGQNILCYAENGGSSFWFMTAGSDAPLCSDYFHKLGHELDHESHVISIENLAKAPFTIYVAEQKVGDMVYVPPRSCHQVVNNGGITIKTSWSRMTIRGLTIGLTHELPIYRRVCRPEVYRIKATIYYALKHFSAEFRALPQSNAREVHQRRWELGSNIQVLLPLFDEIITEEFAASHQTFQHSFSSGPCTLRCDFCGGDIFQSYFECKTCIDIRGDSDDPQGQLDGLVICPGCYCDGRTCHCGAMEPMQHSRYEELVQSRNQALACLHKVQPSMERPDLSEEFSRSPNRVFEAACTIRERRKEPRPRSRSRSRACSTRVQDTPSHEVPVDWVMKCGKCRNFKCYRHMLDFGCHSSQAVLVHKKDKTHGEWHELHRTASQQAFADERPRILEAEKLGLTLWPLHERLALVALRFQQCRPMKPQLVRMGWYDWEADTTSTDPQEVEIADNDTAAQDALPPRFRGTARRPSHQVPAPVTPPPTTPPPMAQPPMAPTPLPTSSPRTTVSPTTPRPTDSLRTTSNPPLFIRSPEEKPSDTSSSSRHADEHQDSPDPTGPPENMNVDVVSFSSPAQEEPVQSPAPTKPRPRQVMLDILLPRASELGYNISKGKKRALIPDDPPPTAKKLKAVPLNQIPDRYGHLPRRPVQRETTPDEPRRDDSSAGSSESSSSSTSTSSPVDRRKPVAGPSRVSFQKSSTLPTARIPKLKPSAPLPDWKPGPSSTTRERRNPTVYPSRPPAPAPPPPPAFLGYQTSFCDPQDLVTLQSQVRNLVPRQQRAEKDIRRLQNERDREPTLQTLLTQVEELQKSESRLKREMKKVQTQQREEIDRLTRAFSDYRRATEARFNELHALIDSITSGRATADAHEAQQHRSPQIVMAGTYYSATPVATPPVPAQPVASQPTLAPAHAPAHVPTHVPAHVPFARRGKTRGRGRGVRISGPSFRPRTTYDEPDIDAYGQQQQLQPPPPPPPPQQQPQEQLQQAYQEDIKVEDRVWEPNPQYARWEAQQQYSIPHDDYTVPHDDYTMPQGEYAMPHDDYAMPHDNLLPAGTAYTVEDPAPYYTGDGSSTTLVPAGEQHWHNEDMEQVSMDDSPTQRVRSTSYNTRSKSQRARAPTIDRAKTPPRHPAFNYPPTISPPAPPPPAHEEQSSTWIGRHVIS